MHDRAILPQADAISAEEWGPGYELWQGIIGWLNQRGPEGTTSLVRVASHLVIVAVAILVIAVSRLELPTWEILQAPGVAPAQTEAGVRILATENSAAVPDNLVRAPVPFTLIPDRPRTEPREHTVVAGDTLYDIAEQYQISADTLVWANGLENNPDLLRLGQQLTILPVNGVLHTLAGGETLESIAKKYNAKISDIVAFEWNQMSDESATLEAGRKLIVPGGVKPMPPKPKPVAPAGAQYAQAPANAPVGAGRFVWPAAGAITQRYGRYHTAVDIGAYTGSPVRAGDTGYVAVAGWSNVGYGYHVIIDHGNGYSTLYAHLSQIGVQAGQAVEKGQQIGAVGSTGRSTGPHLHFEVRVGGGAQNPFNYLP